MAPPKSGSATKRAMRRQVLANSSPGSQGIETELAAQAPRSKLCGEPGWVRQPGFSAVTIVGFEALWAGGASGCGSMRVKRTPTNGPASVTEPNGHFRQPPSARFPCDDTDLVTNLVTKQKATRLGGFRFAANSLI